MNLKLDKKIIIVTNGEQSICKSILKVLASENAIPVVIGKNETVNLKTIESINNKAFQIVADLTKPDECEKAVLKIIEKFNQIDGLINIGLPNDIVLLENSNSENFIASMKENLLRFYLITHYSVPFLKQSKGAIVNISCKTIKTGIGTNSGRSKYGINALTREWAVELLPFKIRVNEVEVDPFFISDPGILKKTFENPEQQIRSINGKIKRDERAASSEEIGKIVSFLLSQKSSHTTGQIIGADGQ